MSEVKLRFGNQIIPREQAEQAGLIAYKFFLSNREPTLSPLTHLSFAVRRYDDKKLFTAEMSYNLTVNKFLRPGDSERSPLKPRLTLPGKLAVALVVPEIESGQLAGESLQEPFDKIKVLDEWYSSLRSQKESQTRLSWLKN